MKSSEKSPKVAAIILCAGKGERAGLPYNKLLYHMGDKTVLDLTVSAFAESGLFDDLLCAASPVDYDIICEIAIAYGARVCVGGETRTDSVRRALAKVPVGTDIVVIHDGARPFACRELLADVIDSAVKFGSGIAAVPTVDAVKVVKDGEVIDNPTKDGLYNAQTPQAFRLSEITDAYARIDGSYGDDCEVYKLAGYRPRIVLGQYTNRKITTHADIFNLASSYRIGFGYDVHRLVSDRDLILGGVLIPYEKGLLGHSDADVLTHALMDALLSAAGLPDIGVLFPDTDPTYAGYSSTKMLESVRSMLEERKIRIIGVSCVVMAEQPKLAKIIPQMIESLAYTLRVPTTILNISATTTEKLGIVGDGAGIAASACVLAGT